MKLDWQVIAEDIISGTATAFICAFGAWLVYKFGFKGKEDAQMATERKKEIFIPLRDELKAIYEKPENIWERINVSFARKVVADDAVYLLDREIASSCSHLFTLIDEYNSIDLNTVAGNILCSRFREKYIELFGSATHLAMGFDQATRQEYEIEEDDLEVENIAHNIAYHIDSIKKIILNREYDEFQIAIGEESPINAYIARMFSMAFDEPEAKYIAGVRDEKKKHELTRRNITPSKYMAEGFSFFEMFDKSSDTQRKDHLLCEIRALAMSIVEDINVVIKKIGQKYEKE